MSLYVLPTTPVTTGLTAGVGGTAAAAVALTYGYNEVDTVLTTGDSLVFPIAIPGANCWVNMQNTGAGASAKIYGQANPQNANAVDQIVAPNSVTLVPGATGVTLANGHATICICTTMGIWKQIV